jgi:phosphate-selective porin OprO/OprP
MQYLQLNYFAKMKSPIILILFLLQTCLFQGACISSDRIKVETIKQKGKYLNDSLPSDLRNNPDSSKIKNQFSSLSNLPLEFSGYIHIRYQHYDQTGNNDGFDIQRARLNLRSTISPKWTFRIQVEFAGKGAPKLIDAYGEWHVNSYLNFTVGQFYIPLSLESLTPEYLQESIYRSQVVEALSNRTKDITGDNIGRDIGAQINGGLLNLTDRNFVDYKFGIFNGAGINVTADNNNYKDLAGRLVFHPLTGIDFGTSVYHGFAVYGTKVQSHLHNRQGCDVSIKYSNFIFKAEYLQGKDSSNLSRSGYYVEGGYFIVPKVLQVLLKYDTYNPNLDKANNYFSDYTICFGYSFTNVSRIQAAYIFRREHETQINNNYAAVRLQLGF